jgi:hypothetical protein
MHRSTGGAVQAVLRAPTSCTMSTSSRPSLRALFVLATLSSVPALGCADRFSTVADQGGDDASDENPGIPGVPLDGAKDDAADSAASAHPDARDDAQDATTEGGEAVEGAAESAVDSSTPMEAATSETGSTCAPPNLQCSAGCVPDDVHNCGTCGHDCTDLPHVWAARRATRALSPSRRARRAGRRAAPIRTWAATRICRRRPRADRARPSVRRTIRSARAPAAATRA